MEQAGEKIQDVMETLSAVAPDGAESPGPPTVALARLKQRALEAEKKSLYWRLELMFRRKSVLAVLSILLIFVVAFSFPGVRAAASDFLGLFRVQKFAPISISPEQMALMEEVLGSGMYPGQIEMIDEPGEPVMVSSLAEAEELAGFDFREPAGMAGMGRLSYLDGGSAKLIIDLESARQLLSLAGADPALLPDSLDGKDVDVTVYSGISVQWDDGMVLLQLPSPLVEYPPDVDQVALGEALLQVLGMERRQASRLARSIDWTTTLLLPIPENVATFSEVRVDGTSGLALSSLDGMNSAIIWQKDDIVHILSGTDLDRLTEISDSLR